MTTSTEYLTLSERCRIAKLNTGNGAARDQLESLERSYFLLAKHAEVLARSKAMQEAPPKDPPSDNDGFDKMPYWGA